MLIKGKFDCTKPIEKLEYSFLVETEIKEIEFKIKNGPFQHVIIQIEDSN